LRACTAAKSGCAAVLAVMTHTGCRVEEVYQLEEAHLDEKPMALTVPKGKTRAAARIIPLPAEAGGHHPAGTEDAGVRAEWLDTSSPLPGAVAVPAASRSPLVRAPGLVPLPPRPPAARPALCPAARP